MVRSKKHTEVISKDDLHTITRETQHLESEDAVARINQQPPFMEQIRELADQIEGILEERGFPKWTGCVIYPKDDPTSWRQVKRSAVRKEGEVISDARTVIKKLVKAPSDEWFLERILSQIVTTLAYADSGEMDDAIDAAFKLGSTFQAHRTRPLLAQITKGKAFKPGKRGARKSTGTRIKFLQTAIQQSGLENGSGIRMQLSHWAWLNMREEAQDAGFLSEDSIYNFLKPNRILTIFENR